MNFSYTSLTQILFDDLNQIRLFVSVILSIIMRQSDVCLFMTHCLTVSTRKVVSFPLLFLHHPRNGKKDERL